MAARPDIDAATGRLDAALLGAGLPGLEPPSDVTPIAALADAVAPYVLPTELPRFWEQVDPEPLAVVTFPMLRGPAYAPSCSAVCETSGSSLRWRRPRSCSRSTTRATATA